jgi:hypothetical protein
MGRQARKTFVVNGNEYAVDMMNPTVAFKYGITVGIALAPVMGGVISAIKGEATSEDLVEIFRGASLADAKKVFEITDIAWQQVTLPDRNPAKNQMAIEAWFAEHPRDMFQVAALSVWKLVEDFFSPELITPAKPSASSGPKG